jgi:hypothetical protein
LCRNLGSARLSTQTTRKRRKEGKKKETERERRRKAPLVLTTDVPYKIHCNSLLLKKNHMLGDTEPGYINTG